MSIFFLSKRKFSRHIDASFRRYLEALELNPVKREHSGTYICQAENSIGLSNEEATDVDVLCKYSHVQTGKINSG